ncbi:MAG: DNA-binding transcriptional activator GcvA [Deltaproteobacteria bacterium ADurb.Bin135]|nr:MAG: DNA-binding transcriptional activator GcvA [Deltaproteobacteria bacterium ADurb.Bin135]
MLAFEFGVTRRLALSNAVKELESELGIEIFYRTAKGISLSVDGREFLSYARQVIEQTELLEQRYLGKKPSKQLCSVSTQHYAFAVNAFVNLLKALDVDEYEFTLRETRTYEIIEDVKNLRSELGIIYLSNFNEKVLIKLLKENHLTFNLLFEADWIRYNFRVPKTEPKLREKYTREVVYFF